MPHSMRVRRFTYSGKLNKMTEKISMEKTWMLSKDVVRFLWNNKIR